ncbi:DEAD/DEAH box helicase family protein, partial [Enterococcus faecalis]
YYFGVTDFVIVGEFFVETTDFYRLLLVVRVVFFFYLFFFFGFSGVCPRGLVFCCRYVVPWLIAVLFLVRGFPRAFFSG